MTDDGEPLPRTVLWRRIDVEGMDACSFDRSENGYLISGTALYQDHCGPAKVEYQVHCDADWSSRSAHVSGWVGSTKKDFTLSRSPEGSWSIGGKRIAGLDGLLDIDLGFTPATNTNAINRLGLGIGAETETTAVWLDVDDWCFKPLTQIYRRLTQTKFAYRSPLHDYAADLITNDFGVIQSYPRLWKAVSGPKSAVA